MGIVQENRLAPQPDVVETEYGAQYVTAATESGESSVSVDDRPSLEKPVKAGRPKKGNKKR